MEQYDVIITGAGPAGICAALQSARLGAKTLLIEKNGIAGGTITGAGVAVPGLFDAYGKQIIGGTGWELVRETLLANGDPLPDFSREMPLPLWKYQVEINPFLFAAIAEEKLLQAGAVLSYHTMPASVRRTGSEWRVTLCGKDGLFEVSAKVLADCSGDANLTKLAGYAVLEPEECQPGTLSVHIDGADGSQADLSSLIEQYLLAEKRGEIRAEDLHFCPGGPEKGDFLFLTRKGMNANHICGINAADSRRKTELEIAARQSVLRAYRFLKKQKGLENLRLRLACAECGVRESRRIVGEYTVTEQDELQGTRFGDAVCWNFYMLDLHDARKGLSVRHLPAGIVPQVPFRALIPKDSENFLAAGRILSSDRYANAALRVQAVCMATGQCAGAAAALSAAKKITPVRLPVTELQNILRQYRAIIPE